MGDNVEFRHFEGEATIDGKCEGLTGCTASWTKYQFVSYYFIGNPFRPRLTLCDDCFTEILVD